MIAFKGHMKQSYFDQLQGTVRVAPGSDEDMRYTKNESMQIHRISRVSFAF